MRSRSCGPLWSSWAANRRARPNLRGQDRRDERDGDELRRRQRPDDGAPLRGAPAGRARRRRRARRRLRPLSRRARRLREDARARARGAGRAGAGASARRDPARPPRPMRRRRRQAAANAAAEAAPARRAGRTHPSADRSGTGCARAGRCRRSRPSARSRCSCSASRVFLEPQTRPTSAGSRRCSRHPRRSRHRRRRPRRARRARPSACRPPTTSEPTTIGTCVAPPKPRPSPNGTRYAPKPRLPLNGRSSRTPRRRADPPAEKGARRPRPRPTRPRGRTLSAPSASMQSPTMPLDGLERGDARTKAKDAPSALGGLGSFGARGGGSAGAAERRAFAAPPPPRVAAEKVAQPRRVARHRPRDRHQRRKRRPSTIARARDGARAVAEAVEAGSRAARAPA